MSAERNGNDIELLSAYLDDQLTTAERSALEARLEEDAQLRRELAQLRATIQLIGSLPELTAPRDFHLTHQMVRPQVQRRTYVFSYLSAAAAVVLFVAGVFLTTQTMNRTTLTSESAANMQNMQMEDQAQVAVVPTNLPLPTLESDVVLSPEILLYATDVASTVPASALTAQESDTTGGITDVQTGVDEQAEEAEAPLSFMFAAPTGTQDAALAAAEVANATMSDAASSSIDQFSAADVAESAITPEQEALGAVAEAALQPETEAPPAADDGAGLAQRLSSPEPIPTALTSPLPPTVIQTETHTATSTPTDAPTITPMPTQPPAPAPAEQAPESGTAILGPLLMIGAVILLAVSFLLLARHRRR